MRGLQLPPGCQLYLGLIHENDGAGDKARAETARRHVKDFGLATECGWGRKDASRVPGLIAAHAQAMAWA
jgi:hypothetical protein